jgi:hypothetical protein
MMFDNKTRKPTTQGTVFFVKEVLDTGMTQAEIEGFWKGELEGLVVLYDQFLPR